MSYKQTANAPGWVTRKLRKWTHAWYQLPVSQRLRYWDLTKHVHPWAGTAGRETLLAERQPNKALIYGYENSERLWLSHNAQLLIELAYTAHEEKQAARGRR